MLTHQSGLSKHITILIFFLEALTPLVYAVELFQCASNGVTEHSVTLVKTVGLDLLGTGMDCICVVFLSFFLLRKLC